MDKNTIIYVGNFDFPFGNASGKRVYGNGKLLQCAGYKTVFVGMNRDIPSGMALEQTKQEFDGFEYYNFQYPKGSRAWIDYKSVLKQFINWVEDRKQSVYAIICYGSPRLSIFITGITRWAKKQNIKVVSDCVDWLESRTGNLLFDFAKTMDTYYQKVIANRRVDGVICISSFLETYYKNVGKNTVVIPPLSCYVSKISEPKSTKNAPVFVYAGSAFRKKVEIKDLQSLKDRVDKMIDILKLLKDNGTDFKLFYYGLDKDNYLTAFPWQKDAIDAMGNCVEFCGFQENELVVEKIKKADFTILIRDKKKSTMAGFPTKVSESISYGTPVITTRTSDIDKYLTEGKEVVFVNPDDLIASAITVSDVIRQKKGLGMNQACAENTLFYFETFEKDIKNFLEKL